MCLEFVHNAREPDWDFIDGITQQIFLWTPDGEGWSVGRILTSPDLKHQTWITSFWSHNDGAGETIVQPNKVYTAANIHTQLTAPTVTKPKKYHAGFHTFETVKDCLTYYEYVTHGLAADDVVICHSMVYDVFAHGLQSVDSDLPVQVSSGRRIRHIYQHDELETLHKQIDEEKG